MYTFVWFSGAICETPSKKTAVILSHLYVIGVKIVLRGMNSKIVMVLIKHTIFGLKKNYFDHYC